MNTPRTSSRLILSVAVLSAAFSLSGCFPLFKTEKEVYDPQTAHPIAVEPDSASLSVPASGTSLPAQSNRDVRAFLAVYKARGHGTLTVARPVGSANEKTARRTSDDILRIATEIGVDPGDLMPRTYTANDSAAPVLLSFTRYTASVGPCGDWSHNYASTTRNDDMPDFGCSTQNNIAAMLEDPHDLVAPRNMDPADAERRTVVFNKYRHGETTVTDRKDTEKADVAKMGGQ